MFLMEVNIEDEAWIYSGWNKDPWHVTRRLETRFSLFSDSTWLSCTSAWSVPRGQLIRSSVGSRYSNTSCFLQHKLFTPTQVVFSNTSCFLQHKLFSSTQVVFSNTSCFLQHKLFSPTQVVFFNTSCLLQHKLFSPTQVVFSNTSCFLQHKLFSSTQVVFSNTSCFLNLITCKLMKPLLRPAAQSNLRGKLRHNKLWPVVQMCLVWVLWVKSRCVSLSSLQIPQSSVQVKTLWLESAGWSQRAVWRQWSSGSRAPPWLPWVALETISLSAIASTAAPRRASGPPGLRPSSPWRPLPPPRDLSSPHRTSLTFLPKPPPHLNNSLPRGAPKCCRAPSPPASLWPWTRTTCLTEDKRTTTPCRVPPPPRCCCLPLLPPPPPHPLTAPCPPAAGCVAPIVTPVTRTAGSSPIGQEKQSVGWCVLLRALLKALSHKEMGAASTLHRVSRLKKKGHKNPTSPWNPPWRWRALRKTGLKLNCDHSSSERAPTWTEAS